MGPPQELLAHLGTVKNPVLLTSSTFSISIMFFSKDLVLATNLIVILTGALMYLLSVAVFLFGLGFYAYAFLRLPSTAQELVFLQEASAAVDRHKASQRTVRAKKTSPDA
jgi:hypothetical protein